MSWTNEYREGASSGGADMDCLDKNNLTPLMAAIHNNKWEIAEYLIGAGADITRRDAAEATLMDYATRENAPTSIMQALHERDIKHAEPRLEPAGSEQNHLGQLRIGWRRVEPDE